MYLNISATPCANNHHVPKVAGCSGQEPAYSGSAKCVYKFWECLTPEITSMTPSTDSMGATIAINGKGFDTSAANNVVSIGKGFNCTVSSASATDLSCKVNHNNTMPINKQLPTMLRLKNNGYVKISPAAKMMFVLSPKVVSVTPSAGSTQGGTNVTMTGYGFAGTPGTTSVNFGSTKCLVTSVTYTQIKCTTMMSSRRKRSTNQAATVVLNGQSVNCTSSCGFTLDPNMTPTVSQINPTTIRGSSTSVTITGTKFGTNSSLVVVKIGNTECAIQSVTDTSITCTAGLTAVGTQQVMVRIEGLGNAANAGSVGQVTVQPEIVAMTPTSGKDLS